MGLLRKQSLGLKIRKAQTNLFSYQDYLEYINFTCYKLNYYTFQIASNKGADQMILHECKGWSVRCCSQAAKSVFFYQGPYNMKSDYLINFLKIYPVGT